MDRSRYRWTSPTILFSALLEFADIWMMRKMLLNLRARIEALEHRRVWRSTNLLERSLGEVKRRTKVIGRFPGETSCLSLCWAVLDLVIAGSNHVRFDDLDRQLIERTATEHSHEEEEVVAA